MRVVVTLAAALVGLALAMPEPAQAQAANPGTTAPTRAPRAAKPKREPTAGQLAARERAKKCGAEWREAKAKGQTVGQKWPQYWSKCNARLKGNAA